MNTKHSPGPWSVFDGQRGNQKLIVNETTTIAQTMCGNDRANAQLIAAAPELLEALTVAREWMRGDKWRNSTVEKHASWEAVMRGIDAAIAKATGENA